MRARKPHLRYAQHNLSSRLDNSTQRCAIENLHQTNLGSDDVSKIIFAIPFLCFLIDFTGGQCFLQSTAHLNQICTFQHLWTKPRHQYRNSSRYTFCIDLVYMSNDICSTGIGDGVIPFRIICQIVGPFQVGFKHSSLISWTQNHCFEQMGY